jgi:hypothetical protein
MYEYTGRADCASKGMAIANGGMALHLPESGEAHRQAIKLQLEVTEGSQRGAGDGHCVDQELSPLTLIHVCIGGGNGHQLFRCKVREAKRIAAMQMLKGLKLFRSN